MIDFVVGMTEAITDIAAVSFAEAFYRAAANGTSLAAMFDLACNQLDLKNLAEAHKPRLHQHIDTHQAYFLDNTISVIAHESLRGRLYGQIPFNPKFMGRERELTELHALLKDKNNIILRL